LSDLLSSRASRVGRFTREYQHRTHRKGSQLTEAAVSRVKAVYARYQSGELTEEAAKTLAKDEIRAIKYGNNDYYLAFDYDGNQILHGARPEREGKNFFTVADPNGKQWVKEQIDRAKDGTGAVYYMAPRLGSDVPVPKLSYSIAFDPWHWVIGTGVYIDDINARFAEVVGNSSRSRLPSA
jgi:methyl-accepting chemotaxis protein